MEKETIKEKFHPLLRHFAVDCAERVKHLMKDERSLAALEVARRYADGEATKKELREARASSWDAAREAADTVARDAADAASWTVADMAATAARYAAESALDAAENKEEEKAWQMDRWCEYCRLGRRPACFIFMLDDYDIESERRHE